MEAPTFFEKKQNPAYCILCIPKEKVAEVPARELMHGSEWLIHIECLNKLYPEKEKIANFSFNR